MEQGIVCRCIWKREENIFGCQRFVILSTKRKVSVRPLGMTATDGLSATVVFAKLVTCYVWYFVASVYLTL